VFAGLSARQAISPGVDDVATGAVKYLSGFSDVTALIGSFPLTDPVTPNAGKPWLFSDNRNMDNSPGMLTRVEGTSAAAVVCSDFGGWEVPPAGGTLRFRRLRTDIWIDPNRDASSNVSDSSSLTTNRGLAVFAALQFHLQRTDPDAVLWGDLVTIGCQLLTDIVFTPVTDGDGLQRGTAYYGVAASGWTDAAE
jgi:hypothetical protein